VQAADVDKACMKELQSLCDHGTGRPALVREYTNRTSLSPLPSRWVIEFKIKEGLRMVKARLCLKGFAERNQHALHTSSPTATRLGRRLVLHWAAEHGWQVASLDVSTAFLQGWTFDQLKSAGYERQPCSFRPPANVWDMLAKINPSLFSQAAADPSQYCLELSTAAYGLKDAPLLWNLRIALTLRQADLRASRHDSCVFFGTDASGTVDLLLSLHVDDALVTGTGPRIAWLHGKMQAAFGPIEQEQGAFRHFGVDVVRDPQTRHVYMSQEFYIQQLWPVVLQRVRGDGRTADTAANDAETTELRSLTSGIAWVGVTHAGAQAAASLFQNALLTPAISDFVRLNCFLDQLRAEYAPCASGTALAPRESCASAIPASAMPVATAKAATSCCWPTARMTA
jgi:hypothetical protein